MQGDINHTRHDLSSLSSGPGGLSGPCLKKSETENHLIEMKFGTSNYEHSVILETKFGTLSILGDMTS